MKKIYENLDYYLITFPRSGKNWLEWYLKTNTEIKFLSAHYPKVKDDNLESSKIISIARDPVSSLSSINTMENFEFIEKRYYQYIEHYEYILSNYKFIFNFYDVTKNTKNVIEFLCQDCRKKYNIINESFEDYKKYHIKVNEKKHLVTSQNNNNYENSIKIIKKMNLKKHNELYLEAINYCIKF